MLILNIALMFSLLNAQENGNIKVSSGQISLKQLISEIEKQTDYTFVIDNSVSTLEIVSLKGGNLPIKEILNEALNKTDITYQISNKKIIITKRVDYGNESISGTIKDESGEPIIGATIIVKGTNNGATSNLDGKFTLNHVSEGSVIEASYIGYTTEAKKTTGSRNINFILTEAPTI